MEHLVVLTGAGMSAESGIATFRDENGLWRNFNPMELASVSGFRRNREAALEFYNARRAQLATVEPNHGHKVLAALENNYRVDIITQNVDDLHERAGSTSVLHLHGQLALVTGINNPNDPRCIRPKPLTEPIGMDEKAADGSRLRPYVVFFGEPVPNIRRATELVESADIFVVIGTSLLVTPAADLLHAPHWNAARYVIDPGDVPSAVNLGYKHIRAGASAGLDALAEILLTTGD